MKNDLISRQEAIDAFWKLDVELRLSAIDAVLDMLKSLPSVQSDRDIPIKPKECIDKSWGISARQAVCPKCEYYLGHVSFIGDHNGKKVTFCETCGQAIDWEGWDFDE